MVMIERDRLNTVRAETLKQWMDQGTVTLVDVREPNEYAKAHIPGAILLPLSRFDPAKIPSDPNRQVVLYCRSGSRSARAAEQLFLAGYTEVTHLGCGIGDWKEKGFEIATEKADRISLMRQVQLVTGLLILLGTGLGATVSPWFFALDGFVGTGLLLAGLTDICLMARLLSALPYNQRS